MRIDAKHIRRFAAVEWSELSGEYPASARDLNRINRRVRVRRVQSQSEVF